MLVLHDQVVDSRKATRVSLRQIVRRLAQFSTELLNEERTLCVVADDENTAEAIQFNLQLFVDGRYSTASTSDLRPEALKTIIRSSAPNT